MARSQPGFPSRKSLGGKKVSGAWNDKTTSRQLVFTPSLRHSHPAYYISCQTRKAKRTCLIPANLWMAVYHCRCWKINSVWIIQMHVCRYISFSCVWINIIDALFTNSSVSQTNTSPLFTIKHIFSSFIPIVFIDSASSMHILSAFLVLYRSEKLVSVRCLHLPVTKTWRMKNEWRVGFVGATMEKYGQIYLLCKMWLIS